MSILSYNHFRGQMNLLICPLFFIFSVVYSEPDRTLGIYLQHNIISDPFITKSLYNLKENNKFGEFQILAEGGYDIVYHEKVTDSISKIERKINSDVLSGKLCVKFNRKDWGINGGWRYNKSRVSWTGEKYTFYGNAKINDNRIIINGWRTINRKLIFNGSLSVQPHLLKAAISSQKNKIDKVKKSFFSGGVDFYSSLALKINRCITGIYYHNKSSLSGSISLINNSNNARRRFPVGIDENILGIVLEASERIRYFFLDNSISIIGGTTFTEESFDLPLFVKGFGNSVLCEAKMDFLPYRPKLSLSENYLKINIKGMDIVGDQFLHADNNSIFQVNGNLFFRLGRHGTMGPTGTFLQLKNSWGNLKLYPFTSWLYLLDIPDQIKFMNISLVLKEFGMGANTVCNINRIHSFKPNIHITGCRINGSMETKDLVRYMGILPVYENHQTHSLIDKQYLIFKGEMEYKYRLGKRHEALFSIQQIIPIEINQRIKNSVSKERISGKRRSLFGGLSITCRFISKL